MATYSKYIGTDYESISSTLIINDDSIQSYAFTENKVVEDLPDNTTKIIVPKSIRNAITSLYDNTIFNETLVGNTYYIGIDKSDLSIKKPYYLGNRLYEGSEIVNSGILSKSDITLNNTSSDTSNTLNSTVVSFLAGTNRTLDASAPRIDSRVVSNNDGTKRIDISLVNNNGDVEILSKLSGNNDPGGYVYINNLRMPSLQESDPSLGMGGSASDMKTLTYYNGSVYWGETIPEDPGYYGATATTVPIYGSETYVNGFSLDFTDDRYCPIELGDVRLGETFSHESLSNVLEKIVYDYLPPLCTLKLSDTNQRYVEIGDLVDIRLDYTITKRTYDTKPSSLKNMIPNQVPSIVSDYTKTQSGNAKGIIILPVEESTTVFEVIVSDGNVTNSASASVTGIYPFYYGVTSSASTMNTSTLQNLEKIIEPKQTIRVDYYRFGITNADKLYFIYDADYGPLNEIYDPNGSPVISYFDQEIIVLSSPNGFWFSKPLRVYTLPNYYSNYIGPNTLTTLFRFEF